MNVHVCLVQYSSTDQWTWFVETRWWTLESRRSYRTRASAVRAARRECRRLGFTVVAIEGPEASQGY